MIQIKPNFDLHQFKKQLHEAKTEKDRLSLLLGFHLKLRHASANEMYRLLAALDVRIDILKLIPVVVKQCCEACRRYQPPLNKPGLRATLAMHFNHRVQGDLFFVGDKIWLILVDEHIRYKQVGRMPDKISHSYLKTMVGT